MKEGWEYKKLGEVCEIFDKQRKPVTKSARTNGVYPYYGATGIQDYVADYIFDGRFVLIGEDGAKWGACENTAFIIEGKSWVNNHAHIIKFDSNIIDSFAVYFLNFSNLDSFISGAVVRKLTQASMKDIVLPLPPLSVQQAIVAELDKINEVIALKRAQLKDLDLLAQSIFYNMFGDPIENPKGWDVKNYGECFTIGAGGTPSKSKEEYWEGGTIPWIGSNMCQNTVIYETDGKYITEDGLKHSSAKMLDEGTVLVALVGATIGKVALLKTPTSTNQNVAFIKVNTNQFDSYYVFFHLQSLYELFVNIGNGEFKMANQGFIKSLPMTIPPLPLQQEFAKKIEAIEVQKTAIKQSLSEAETLLASRMDYWFN